MATKRSFKSRRKIVKSKKALPKILVIGGVAVAGYYAYQKLLKPYLQSMGGRDTNADLTTTTDQAISQVVQSASTTTPNIPSTTNANTFSPIGTEYSKLNITKPITYGSKGEEVLQMQKFINAGLKNLGINKSVPVDGIFGPLTWAVHKGISFNAQPLYTWAVWLNNTKNDDDNWLGI